jgi:hypothetical protein
VEPQSLVLEETDTPERGARLHELTELLQSSLSRLEGAGDGAQIRLYTLETLASIGSAHGLADRAMVRWAEEKIDGIDLPRPMIVADESERNSRRHLNAEGRG